MGRNAEDAQALPGSTAGFVPAPEPPTDVRNRIVAGARWCVALLDRLNGSTPAAQVHETDYQHLMKVTDT